MFLSLFNGFIIKEEDIIGIFDLDTSTESASTRLFLRKSEADGKMRVAVRNIPRSFVVTEKEVFLSHQTEGTLIKSLKEK